jgi:hypothetical protein
MVRSLRATMVVVATVTLIVIGGSGMQVSYAGDGAAIPRFHKADLPFALTENSVAKGAFVFIGDLRVEGPAVTALGPSDPEQLQRCIEAGSEWLRWSSDGMSIEMTWAPREGNTVSAVYCDSDVILVGGISRKNPANTAWLFEMIRDVQAAPTRVYFTSKFASGKRAQEKRYILTEVQSIDPRAGRIVFRGMSERGEAVELSAPIAIRAPSSSR